VLRLFGEKIDRKVKYQRRVGAYGIIVHKNELLLTEQIISENNSTDLNEINKLFTIKTDEDVETVNLKTGKSNNYYRRGEKT